MTVRFAEYGKDILQKTHFFSGEPIDMSHTPERPRLYVCENCNVVHAGHHSPEGQHHFEPPEECGACGSDGFVEIEQMTRP